MALISLGLFYFSFETNICMTKLHDYNGNYKLQHNVNINDKNNPSNRIRTSDLRISALIPLQSSALPTELSREGYIMQFNLFL